MTDRQFLWGLSNGTMVLAVAGAFWLGLGTGLSAGRLAGWQLGVLTLCQVGGCIGLLWGALRLRRRAGFHRAELRAATGLARLETRHIQTMLGWTALLQGILTAAVVGLCLRVSAEWLIWPGIGLVVSFHFVPLARVFHVRAYYVTALAGAAVCLVAMVMGPLPRGLVVLSGGMTLAMWGSGAYLLANSGGIAGRAVSEVWAVQQGAAPDRGSRSVTRRG